VVVGLFGFTRYQVNALEKRYPPVGKFVSVEGRELHIVDVPAITDEKTAVLFIHGASGNLLDQMHAFRPSLEGRRRMLFVDRPGHGYSQRGKESANSPSGQAASFAQMLDQLAIDQAIVVCHSLGCASAAAMAVHHPDKIKGLVFLAPATHSWPGGVTWYYSVASMPVIGWLFTELLSLPAGLASINAGVASVFEPDKAPDGYAERMAAPLVLRPVNFRNNARDVAGLKAAVAGLQDRYKEISKPTIIITGDRDDVVLAAIHSKGLERDIANSQLIVGEGVGHKPDYVMTKQVLEAIDHVDR